MSVWMLLGHSWDVWLPWDGWLSSRAGRSWPQGAAEEPSQHCPSLSGASAQRQTTAHPCKCFQARNPARSKLKHLECHRRGRIVLFHFPGTKLALWDTNTGAWKPPTPLLQVAWLMLANYPAHGAEASQLHGIILIAAFSESWAAFQLACRKVCMQEFIIKQLLFSIAW